MFKSIYIVLILAYQICFSLSELSDLDDEIFDILNKPSMDDQSDSDRLDSFLMKNQLHKEFDQMNSASMMSVPKSDSSLKEFRQLQDKIINENNEEILRRMGGLRVGLNSTPPLPIVPAVPALPAMPVVPVPIPQPIVIPGKVYYEPVIHDHPPLHKIKKLLKLKGKNKEKYLNEDSSGCNESSETSDDSSSNSASTNSETDTSFEYYDDFFGVRN